MNPIEQQLQNLKQEKRLGLMTHVVAGYPSLNDTRQLVRLMAIEGVDFIEIQIPFSDPLGDGPIIRAANTIALNNGVKVSDIFQLTKELTSQVKIPMFFMTYLNIVYAYGLKKFCKDAKDVGIRGLIIPDYNLDFEEREHFEEFVKENELILIRFTSLGSSTERLVNFAKNANGFVYCFSSYGVTGTRNKLDIRLIAHLQKLRGIFSQPLAVGFGISTPEHLQELKGQADIAVVGSALITEFNQGGLLAVQKKLQELKKVL